MDRQVMFHILCKGGHSLETGSIVVITGIDNDQLKATAKADPHIIREAMWTIWWPFGTEANWKREKAC